jgi:hypothetical protein
MRFSGRKPPEDRKMALVFDMLVYRITRDIDRALIASASNARPPKPRTVELYSFALHAKRIVYFESHGKAWGRTTASALSECVKDHRIAVHLPSPYRVRIVAFDTKIWFIDMYFSRSVVDSETWVRKLKSLLEETRKNGGSMCRNLHDRFYPSLIIMSDMPKINWKALEDKPFMDD